MATTGAKLAFLSRRGVVALGFDFVKGAYRVAYEDESVKSEHRHADFDEAVSVLFSKVGRHLSKCAEKANTELAELEELLG